MNTAELELIELDFSDDTDERRLEVCKLDALAASAYHVGDFDAFDEFATRANAIDATFADDFDAELARITAPYDIAARRNPKFARSVAVKS
jgi:hypothetical protein